MSSRGGLAPLTRSSTETAWTVTTGCYPCRFNQVQGKTYCLNQDYRIPVFLYRADAFKAIGVTAPPATFDEVLRIAKDFSSAGKLFFPAGMGAAGGVFPGQAFLEFLGASMIVQKSDGAYFAADGREPAFSKAAVEAAPPWSRSCYSSKASTPAALNWGYTEVQQALQTGTASSSTFGLYRFNTLKASGAADLAWAPPPAFEAGGKQVIQGQALSINNASQKKDAAWEFVKFMTSPETQAGLARGGEVVSRKSAYTNPYFSQPEAANLVAWKDLVQQRGQSVSYSVNYAAFGEVVSNALERDDPAERLPVRGCRRNYEQLCRQNQRLGTPSARRSGGTRISPAGQACTGVGRWPRQVSSW